MSWADAAEAMAKLPAVVDELKAAAPALAQAVAPCGPAAVIETLAPMLALYGIGKKSEAEAEAFWGFYLDALSDLPLEAIRAGVNEYVADARSEWFPKPGPLKAICERHAIPVRMAESRARRALSLIEQSRTA